MIPIRFPRTIGGWKRLFWLALYRCPIHHTGLNVDWPQYDDGVHGFCFKCDGVSIWPMGLLTVLHLNHLAQERKNRDATA